MTSRPRAVDGARISGPDELLQAVPYLLGFQPQDSLVLIGLDAGRLVVTSRLDLRDACVGGVPHAVAAMVRGGSTAFVAAVFAGRGLVDIATGSPWSELAAQVATAVHGAGAELLDVLLVNGDRWWSLTCENTECCPASGRQLPESPSPFAAAATVDGVVVLPDRAALAALLEPLPPAQRQRLRPMVAAAEHAALRRALAGEQPRWERSVKRALFRAARDSDDTGWAGIPDERVAEFGAAVRLARLRDAVWLAVDGGRLDGRTLWRELGRRLPSPYDAAPLFLYGWASWRAGNGAAAGIAGDLAIAGDPGYTAADLLRAAVANGVSPHRVPRLRLPKVSQPAGDPPDSG
jgi:hypothetical protein